jgi:hypothetical protein
MTTTPNRASQIGVVVVFLVALIPFMPFKVDAAYISFVYAKNLAAGQGLTYNGIVVEGYSNPLWTVMLSPFIRLGADPLVVARVFSVLSGTIAMLLILQLCSSLVRNSDTLLSFLATTSVAVISPFLAWTMGGLETIFLSLLLVLLVYNEWGEKTKYNWISPLLLVMIAMTRPEGMIIFIIWLFHRTYLRVSQIKTTSIDASIFVALFSVFLFWRWRTYGYFLPNTAYLKLGTSFDKFVNTGGWLFEFFFLRPVFGLLLALGLVVILTRWARFKRSLLLPMGIMAWFFAFALYAGLDWMPHHRFLAPVAPFMAFFVAVVLNAFERPKVRIILASLAIIAIGFEFLMANTLYRQVSVDFGNFTDGLVRGGEWINNNTSETAVIAVVDAGALAYYGNRPTIDIVGLNDEHIAHSNTKSDFEYVLSYQPDVIQLHVGFTKDGRLLKPTAGVEYQIIIENEDFLGCYEPDLQRPADPYYPFLFLRACD